MYVLKLRHKICEIRSIFLITIIKIRYYVVDNVQYIKEIKHECSSEDMICIHNFLNENIDQVIYYLKSSPGKNTNEIPTSPYFILQIICIIVFVPVFVWFAYNSYEVITSCIKYQEYTQLDSL